MKFLVLAEVFDGFGDFDDFSSVLRFLLYPNVPLVLCFLQTKKSTILSQF